MLVFVCGFNPFNLWGLIVHFYALLSGGGDRNGCAYRQPFHTSIYCGFPSFSAPHSHLYHPFFVKQPLVAVRVPAVKFFTHCHLWRGCLVHLGSLLAILLLQFSTKFFSGHAVCIRVKFNTHHFITP